MVAYPAMIRRIEIVKEINEAFCYGRIVALLGPRQCGKTTLARMFVPEGTDGYFDLEDPVGCAKLSQPMDALSKLKGTVVIDEVQRQPDLFPVLRVLADRKPLPAKFLILGSASPDLIKHSSESLAGRMARVVIGGFSLEEAGQSAVERHWLRGGLPLIFLGHASGRGNQSGVHEGRSNVRRGGQTRRCPGYDAIHAHCP